MLSVPVMLLMSLTGCYKHTMFYKNTVYLGPPPGLDTYEESASFVFWGAFPHHEIDMNEICPQGVSRIEEHQDLTDGLLGCVTLGFVRSVNVKVTCADGKAFSIVPQPELSGSWVLPVEG